MSDETSPLETTSAGGVVVNPGGFILVVKQRGETWSLPKGHVEKGESLIDAARREIYEESGVSDLIYVEHLGEYRRRKELSRFGGPELKQITLFLFFTNQTRLGPIDCDNTEALWVPSEDVTRLLTYSEDREFFLQITEKLQKKLRMLGWGNNG